MENKDGGTKRNSFYQLLEQKACICNRMRVQLHRQSVYDGFQTTSHMTEETMRVFMAPSSNTINTSVANMVVMKHK